MYMGTESQYNLYLRTQHGKKSYFVELIKSPEGNSISVHDPNIRIEGSRFNIAEKDLLEAIKLTLANPKKCKMRLCVVGPYTWAGG